MSGIFITGTDTGVGKTVVCGGLARRLREEGWNVATQKWVQTGGGDGPADIETHGQLAGESGASCVKEPQRAKLRCPYVFELPASPHLAAAAEGAQVDPGVIIDSYRTLEECHDCVIVEGSGGILVPLSESLLFADLVAELGLAAVIVADNKLGCINHSLLTIEALRQRNIPIIGMVFNNTGQQEATDDVVRIQRDNPRIIGKLGAVEVLGEMQHVEDLSSLHRHFRPIFQAVRKRLTCSSGLARTGRRIHVVSRSE